MKVLVIADHNNHELNKSTLSTITAGKKIGKVDLLIIGYKCENVVKASSNLSGVEKIYVNDNECFANFLSENSSEYIKQFSSGYSHLLFTNNSNGKNIAPRTAALLDSMIIPDIIEILDNDTFKRPIYAGNAIATCKSKDKIKIITVRTTAFEETENIQSSAEIIQKSQPIQNENTKYLGSEIEKSERPELTSADIVVSGGRGLGSAENFQILEKLADKLGAAMGASRAAVDAGFVPNDWQVGQTGKIVAPNLYIAVGISGAIQHLAGMKDSKVIAAINKDEEAPIFTVSDYGLAEDLFKAIPEMEKKIS
tara:strand:+ start:2621 stop:3550 length:930 start_codon:yes stop_codon:yes gene_type:complete